MAWNPIETWNNAFSSTTENVNLRLVHPSMVEPYLPTGVRTNSYLWAMYLVANKYLIVNRSDFTLALERLSLLLSPAPYKDYIELMANIARNPYYFKQLSPTDLSSSSNPCLKTYAISLSKNVEFFIQLIFNDQIYPITITWLNYSIQYQSKTYLGMILDQMIKRWRESSPLPNCAIQPMINPNYSIFESYLEHPTSRRFSLDISPYWNPVFDDEEQFDLSTVPYDLLMRLVPEGNVDITHTLKYVAKKNIVRKSDLEQVLQKILGIKGTITPNQWITGLQIMQQIVSTPGFVPLSLPTDLRRSILMHHTDLSSKNLNLPPCNYMLVPEIAHSSTLAILLVMTEQSKLMAFNIYYDPKRSQFKSQTDVNVLTDYRIRILIDKILSSIKENTCKEWFHASQ